jgi:predicted nucleic acid-binding protein
MIAGIIDTNILIELYRNLAAAKAWAVAQTDLAILTITWLEFMEGARGKAGQARCQQIVMPFEVILLSGADQQWTMNQLTQYRLTYGVSFKDCLIASAAYRLQVPLYTKNIRDFGAILPNHLVIKPY